MWNVYSVPISFVSHLDANEGISSIDSSKRTRLSYKSETILPVRRSVANAGSKPRISEENAMTKVFGSFFEEHPNNNMLMKMNFSRIDIGLKIKQPSPNDEGCYLIYFNIMKGLFDHFATAYQVL